jgi:site-specific DNA-cytosine methylase
LQRARPDDAVVVASYDINPVANATYAHNFGRKPSGRDIRALTPAALDAHDADLWLLSPPCQARGARCACCVLHD